MNGEFARRANGPADLVASGYQGYDDWEYCHPALEDGRRGPLKPHGPPPIR